MKIKAVANGDVIDVAADAAKLLIDAGIYTPVDEPKKSTKVEPLTTKDFAPPAKKKAAK
jgi:hypothetical protein